MSKLHPTTGERRVGWYFEPSGNDVADGIKTQCAALIDLLSAYIELDPEKVMQAQKLFEDGCAVAQRVFLKK